MSWQPATSKLTIPKDHVKDVIELPLMHELHKFGERERGHNYKTKGPSVKYLPLYMQA
jgi:hypothetical protein